jgi:methionyl-tRNA formyltransferase
VQRAILAGDEVTGASTFRLEEGLDTGPVYGVVTEMIGASDTSGDLLGRLALSGARLLVATLDGIEDGTLVPQPQPAEGVTLAPKLSVADAEVDWSQPALAIDRFVRACTPEPGAWTLFRGERVGLEPVLLDAHLALTGAGLDRPSAGSADAAGSPMKPGELRPEKNRVLVGTGSHPVALGAVRPAGRRPMAAPDWARGARPTSADRLG